MVINKEGTTNNYRKQFEKNTLKTMSLLLFVIFHIIVMLIFTGLQNSQETQIIICTYIASIQLILSMKLLVRFGYNLFSMPILFLVFSFIFHFGHLVLYILNIKVARTYNIFDMVSLAIILKACKFVIFSTFYIVYGIVLTSTMKVRSREKNSDTKIQISTIYKVGCWLFGLGILPKLYIDLSKIVLFLMKGYLATYTLRVPGIINTIANMSEYGILMIMVGKQNDKKRLKLIFTCFLLYQTFIMLSGNRGRPMVVIIAAVFIYWDLKGSITKKQILKVGLVGYIGVVFLMFYGNLRNPYLIDASIVEKVRMSFSSPIANVLDEFGGTMLTLCYSVLYFPKVCSQTFGMNYITSFFSVFPNIGGILNGFKESSIFVYKFPVNLALGGSYLGELYYSFNEMGRYFAIFIGAFIGIVSKNLLKTNRNKDWLKYSISMVIFVNIIWWVRGYFYDMARDIILVPIFILVLYKLQKKELKKKEN